MERVSRRLNLSVQYACNAAELPSRPLVRSWVRAALDVDGGRGGRIVVRFVDPEEGRQLNHDYRGRDYATNVLSFPYEQEPVVCGDLVVCAEVAAREAVEQGKTLTAHYAHLCVHGILHLLGYDHEISDDEADIMEQHEREVMAALGFSDPYALSTAPLDGEE
ncbi:rRNA maturation RNase YbeY [Rhodocyclus gracilis]|uniref:Endoribonuclease YbeY n=1 Tax=Rhodocyclus tenuis TaxID=1066 RepID=A0A6L5JZH5_RHOTE|nr:rRNA maturation RNase YbeY [Rhodocyclus gracilis]MQY52703.1 rRNA maturation RNase YbeY [Rhodocyclus gracilis]